MTQLTPCGTRPHYRNDVLSVAHLHPERNDVLSGNT